MDSKAPATATPTAAVLYGSSNYVKNTPACPSGGAYTIGDMATRPSCDGDATHVLP
jgi:hypothetical protein